MKINSYLPFPHKKGGPRGLLYSILLILSLWTVSQADNLKPIPTDSMGMPVAVLYGQLPNGNYVPVKISSAGHIIVVSTNTVSQTYYISISSITPTSLSAAGKDISWSVSATGNCAFNINSGSPIYIYDGKGYGSDTWGSGIDQAITINITSLEAGATVQAVIEYKK